MQAVAKHLWSDPECKPGNPSAEELDLQRRHYEGLQREQLSNKVLHGS